MLLRFPRQPVRASAPGCIDQVLELDPTNPRIVLQRALRVRVEVPTGPAVLDPHFPPFPHLEPIDDERASNANSTALDPESEPERRTADRERSPPHVSLLYSSRNVTRSGSRDSTFAVSAPGRYRASWRMFGNAKLRAGAVEFVIDAIDGPELTIQTNFAPDDYATAVAACRATLEAARQRHNKQR